MFLELLQQPTPQRGATSERIKRYTYAGAGVQQVPTSSKEAGVQQEPTSAKKAGSVATHAGRSQASVSASNAQNCGHAATRAATESRTSSSEK